jgi:predicted DNA-binding antitoxin AbrB/MazE fold protein
MSEPLPITVNAVYEKGALQLDRALGLPEGTKLQLTIIPAADKGVFDATDRKIIAEILAEDDEVFQALAK